MQIKVGPDTVIRFGLLLQPQLDLAENPNGSGQTSQNLLLRRTRFIVSGQATKKAFFFFQTENSRLGNATTTKTISTGFQTIDAVVEYRFMRQFNLWGGLIYIPSSREALKSSSSQFMIDQNTYAYVVTGALGGTAGRDTGFMARGYFAGDRLEYRAGVFSGLRTAGARNAYRKVARLQWEFADTEPYTLPSYPGSYFGTKRVIALGAAWDNQGSFKAPTADLYVDLPTAFGSALGTISYMHLDPGTFATTATNAIGGGRSNVFVIDAGAFFKNAHKIGPWLRYEHQSFSSPKQANSVKRYIAGINWFPYINNFNIKSALINNKPNVGKSYNEYILQMQFFIY